MSDILKVLPDSGPVVAPKVYLELDLHRTQANGFADGISYTIERGKKQYVGATIVRREAAGDRVLLTFTYKYTRTIGG